jgi:hypothetical protein
MIRTDVGHELKGEIDMRAVMNRRRFVVPGVLIVLVWVFSLNVAAATPCCEGTQWLKASVDAKTAYIDGYIEGVLRGFGQGCLTGTKEIKASKPGAEADPFHKCLSKSLVFSRSTGEYVESVTEFYERYPDDRGMRVSDVLARVSRGQTLEQIHAQRK